MIVGRRCSDACKPWPNWLMDEHHWMLGIGSGRIGLPLSQRGVPVAGIDNAPAMLDALRAKPGSEQL